MSSHSRRFALLAPLALAACGFSPLYAPGGTGARLQGRVLVDEPGDENSYLLTRELEERLGRGDTPVYGLTLAVLTSERQLAVNREGYIERFNLVGRADYSLRDLTSGAIVTSGFVENFTGYSATGTTVVTLAGERDARERLMNILADQITARLLAVDFSA
ncbi:MAG: LPS assembly lipoprotein LptE [Sulfitobacter sp.]|nr:LPS assembly lipoprotein LptE [Sulfitobacter sp.]